MWVNTMASILMARAAFMRFSMWKALTGWHTCCGVCWFSAFLVGPLGKKEMRENETRWCERFNVKSMFEYKFVFLHFSIDFYFFLWSSSGREQRMEARTYLLFPNKFPSDFDVDGCCFVELLKLNGHIVDASSTRPSSMIWSTCFTAFVFFTANGWFRSNWLVVASGKSFSTFDAFAFVPLTSCSLQANEKVVSN